MRHYFTKTEIALWSVSAAAIILSFIMFDGKSFLDACLALRPGLYLRRRVLCRVPCKRYLRFYLVEEAREKAKN